MIYSDIAMSSLLIQANSITRFYKASFPTLIFQYLIHHSVMQYLRLSWEDYDRSASYHTPKAIQDVVACGEV